MHRRTHSAEKVEDAAELVACAEWHELDGRLERDRILRLVEQGCINVVPVTTLKDPQLCES